jgi:hypothetical protein
MAINLDINALRSTRNTDFSTISAAFEKSASGNKSHEDNRFWKPERDKAGNATATIRFLAKTPSDELPWIKLWSHGFQGPTGQWFIDNCNTTIERPCPVCELNTQLWAAGTGEGKNKSPERTQASDQRRKLTHISNILVVNDPKHPENNGKVFLFKYGKKIFDMLMDKAQPVFEDQAPINVFDYWEGANFKLRMKTVDKRPNYDSSEFEGVSPVAATDEEILEIAKSQYELKEFISPSNFKDYEVQQKRLQAVLSGIVNTGTAEESMSSSIPLPEPPPTAPAPKKAPAMRSKPEPQDNDDADEATIAYFQSIANEE